MKLNTFLIPVIVLNIAFIDNANQEKWSYGGGVGSIWPLGDSNSEPEVSNGAYSNAAVACDSPKCAKIGITVLTDGGSVADAAIAALLCMGVIGPETSGIGGGFFAIMYNAASRETKTLNAREAAGLKATKDMFKGDPSIALRGPLSVAVPGEMKGLWELYKRAGKLPWARLLQPTIDLCKNGIKVTVALAGDLKVNREGILKEPSMRDIFMNPLTKDVWKEGDTMKRPFLVKTLEIIAKSKIGGDEMYRGKLANVLADDMKKLGSIITLDDLKSYRVKWEKPIEFKLKDHIKLHVGPPPSGGILVGYIMSLLNNYLDGPSNLVTNYQRIVEAFKHACAKRTFLGDPSDPTVTKSVAEAIMNMTSQEYVVSIRRLIKDTKTSNDVEYYGAEYYEPEDHGTAHVSIVGPNGDAIAVTTTVNNRFGAEIRSRRTGIIMNDEMDDFSSPNITNSDNLRPSPYNFIKPGKRPMSSMSPAIFTDSKGNVRLVIGAAGGSQIISNIAMLAMRHLWFKQPIKEAMEAKRLHHQLYPMEILYEDGFSEVIINDLKKFGHKTKKIGNISVGGAVAGYENGTIFASSDPRKTGSVAGF